MTTTLRHPLEIGVMDPGLKLLPYADLSGGNVMLVSNAARPHGFCAKITDFGLSRVMDVQSRMQTRMYGTVCLHSPTSVSRSKQMGLLLFISNLYRSTFGCCRADIVAGSGCALQNVRG